MKTPNREYLLMLDEEDAVALLADKTLIFALGNKEKDVPIEANTLSSVPFSTLKVLGGMNDDEFAKLGVCGHQRRRRFDNGEY
jgi:hypothetical protein